MKRSNLTIAQRKLIDRAAAEPDGRTLCWTGAETRVAKRLEEMGLGKASVTFDLNEAGRALSEQPS